MKRYARKRGRAVFPCPTKPGEDDDEHKTLLIKENLRRCQLSTSSMARAIKRLYEIRGIDGTGPKQDGATVALIAKETGKSERTIKRLRTIADLIPELSAVLDSKAITQKVAYQLAQMDENGQRLVFKHVKKQEEYITIKEEST